MTTTPTLTVTQHSALAELRRRGSLTPSTSAFVGSHRMFSERTLQALVDAGAARWEVVRNSPGGPAVAAGIVLGPAVVYVGDPVTCYQVGHYGEHPADWSCLLGRGVKVLDRPDDGPGA